LLQPRSVVVVLINSRVCNSLCSNVAALLTSCREVQLGGERAFGLHLRASCIAIISFGMPGGSLTVASGWASGWTEHRYTTPGGHVPSALRPATNFGLEHFGLNIAKTPFLTALLTTKLHHAQQRASARFLRHMLSIVHRFLLDLYFRVLLQARRAGVFHVSPTSLAVLVTQRLRLLLKPMTQPTTNLNGPSPTTCGSIGEWTRSTVGRREKRGKHKRADEL